MNAKRERETASLFYREAEMAAKLSNNQTSNQISFAPQSRLQVQKKKKKATKVSIGWFLEGEQIKLFDKQTRRLATLREMCSSAAGVCRSLRRPQRRTRSWDSERLTRCPLHRRCPYDAEKTAASTTPGLPLPLLLLSHCCCDGVGALEAAAIGYAHRE